MRKLGLKGAKKLEQVHAATKLGRHARSSGVRASTVEEVKGE